MKNLVHLLLINILFGGMFIVYAQVAQPTPARLLLLEADPELRAVYIGVSGNPGMLSSQMWTLTHAYESKPEVDLVLKFLVSFFGAVDSNDGNKVVELGGAKGFKEKFASFLNSKDEAVRAFAAVILGMTGDDSYAPKIAALIRERDPSFKDRFASKPVFYRGRAAYALGILKAGTYKTEIAELLTSKNQYDRAGAVSALSELKAVEYTPIIVRLLTVKEFEIDDDESPIRFLVETGQAGKYKTVLVKVMLSAFRSDASEAAAYALAAIGAKEHAVDVAKLLTKEFRKGTAAKVLALLGAKRYARQIAALLDSKSSLVRNDAIFALAILDAKVYLPRIVKLLDPSAKDSSAIYAAEAILQMRARSHYGKALRILSFKLKERPFPMAGELHDFVVERREAIRKELERAIDEATKARAP